MLCFIVTLVLRFSLLPYYQRILRDVEDFVKHLMMELYQTLNSVFQKVGFHSLSSVLLTVGPDRWYLGQEFSLH